MCYLELLRNKYTPWEDIQFRQVLVRSNVNSNKYISKWPHTLWVDGQVVVLVVLLVDPLVVEWAVEQVVWRWTMRRGEQGMIGMWNVKKDGCGQDVKKMTVGTE